MCRNIKPLFNFEPPATAEEINNAALQYVRKVSGFVKPTKTNEAVFQEAVRQVAHSTEALLQGLITGAPGRNREVEAAKRREKSRRRFKTVSNNRNLYLSTLP